jgi:hypothetical protein
MKSPLNMAQKDRRKNRVVAPETLEELLNQHQQRALPYIEATGWRLFCVRTALFGNPVVVVVNSEGDVFATLEYDGELNVTPLLSLRRDDLTA